MIRVVVADDHAIVRQGIRALLEAADDFEVIAEAADGATALEAVAEHQPGVLLLDLSMPKLNGVETIRRVRRSCSTTQVLVLSMHESADWVRPALRAGALGYVVKGGGLDDLLPALRAVARGERFLDQRATCVAAADDAERASEGDEVERLTAREREVLQLIAEGNTNREIAARLALSLKTVDAHRTNLMRKLGMHNVQEVTRFALRNRIIVDPG